MTTHCAHSGTGKADNRHMTQRVAAFLAAVGLFMIIEWINLGFNLADGHETAFYVVHGVLIAVNVALGAVLALLGWRAWRGRGVAGQGAQRRGDRPA